MARRRAARHRCRPCSPFFSFHVRRRCMYALPSGPLAVFRHSRLSKIYSRRCKNVLSMYVCFRACACAEDAEIGSSATQKRQHDACPVDEPAAAVILIILFMRSKCKVRASAQAAGLFFALLLLLTSPSFIIAILFTLLPCRAMPPPVRSPPPMRAHVDRRGDDADYCRSSTSHDILLAITSFRRRFPLYARRRRQDARLRDYIHDIARVTTNHDVPDFPHAITRCTITGLYLVLQRCTSKIKIR